jgi:translation initiation factor 2 beta subunit (eIF-2beta)/eIF-5
MTDSNIIFKKNELNLPSFTEMLDDVYLQINNTTFEETTLILPIPELEKNNTRMLWKVESYLKRIERPKEHFYNFLTKKKGYTVNWVSNLIEDGLIIHSQKINQIIIINIMKEYVNLYVLCNSCKNSQTEMKRDNEIKKYRIKCINCNSEYTVAE